MKADQKKENEEVTKAAEDDRKYIYQATIVRYVCRDYNSLLQAS